MIKAGMGKIIVGDTLTLLKTLWVSSQHPPGLRVLLLRVSSQPPPKLVKLPLRFSSQPRLTPSRLRLNALLPASFHSLSAFPQAL